VRGNLTEKNNIASQEPPFFGPSPALQVTPVYLDNPNALTIYYHSLSDVDDRRLLKGGLHYEENVSVYGDGSDAGALPVRQCSGSGRDQSWV